MSVLSSLTILSPNFDWSQVPGITETGDIHLKTFFNDERIQKLYKQIEEECNEFDCKSDDQTHMYVNEICGRRIALPRIQEDDTLYFGSRLEDGELHVSGNYSPHLINFALTLLHIFQNATLYTIDEMEDLYPVYNVWVDGEWKPIQTNLELYQETFGEEHLKLVEEQYWIKLERLEREQEYL